MGAELGNSIRCVRKKKKIKNYRSTTKTPEITRTGRTLVIHLLDGKTHKDQIEFKISQITYQIQRITNTEERIMQSLHRGDLIGWVFNIKAVSFIKAI